MKYRTVFKKINMAYMTKITKRDKTEKSAVFAAVLQLGKYCLLQ